MTACYFAWSPQGFANDVEIFAVDAEQAEDWLSWFNARQEPSAPRMVRVTRRQAARLLRRDGVLLQTHEDDADFLAAEHLQDRLNPESVRSACRAAISYRAHCAKEDAFAAEMAAAYPELAVEPR